MEYFFNELSLSPVDSLTHARQVMTNFVHACNRMRQEGFTVMRAVSNGDKLINTYNLFGNYHVYDWKKDESVDDVERNLLRDVLNRYIESPLIDLEDVEIREQLSNIYVRIDDENRRELDKDSGITIANHIGSIAISFSANEFWNQPYIKVTQIIFVFGDETKEVEDEVKNVAHHSHVDSHRDWLITKGKGMLFNWKPSENYFPFLEYSDALVPKSDWGDYYRNCRACSVEERISRYEEISKKIAETNGYSRNDKLTKKNDRTIFGAGTGKGRMYLALDTQHGTFEVCNFKGDHVGEYNFAGVKLEDGDHTHGISI